MRSPEVNMDLPGGNRWICYLGKYVSSLSLDRGVGPGKGRAAMAMAKSALAAMADVVPSQTGQPDAICSTIATIRHSCGNNFFVSNLSLGHVFPPSFTSSSKPLPKLQLSLLPNRYLCFSSPATAPPLLLVNSSSSSYQGSSPLLSCLRSSSSPLRP